MKKLLLVALLGALLVGCGGPACELECDITMEAYGFSVSCESGPHTTSMSDATTFLRRPEGDLITVEVDQDLTYSDSGNTYEIEGQIWVDEATNTVSYEITATGGVFKGPQTCKSETTAP